MNASTFTLSTIRSSLAQPWLIAVFGVAYLVSQITIIIILGPIDEEMITLQTTGFSAADYVEVFSSWQASGEMAIYKAHFILDDPHPIWYAGLFTTLLCWLFLRLNVADKHNWLLFTPVASGLLDWYENRLQHIFLSSSDFSNIVDPLPMYSTLASDVKWILALVYIGLSAVLLIRYFAGRSGNVGRSRSADS